MKCRKCGARAVINMPQHRLSLCKDHYLSWFSEQTERFIDKYKMFSRQDNILVAVSGGKDSLSLWDVLWRSGYKVDGLYIGLGVDDGTQYSVESRGYAEAFANERGLKLHVLDVNETYYETVPQMAERSRRGQGKPCAVCGLVKRHVMNGLAHDLGYQVLVTGHNLDDEAAVLFGNTLNWNEDMLRRQSPVLEENQGLARKAKPFCRFYERETAAYALLRGIPYIYDECPFSKGSQMLAHKETLNRLEAERPGTKLIFYLNFLAARENGLFTLGVQQERYPIKNCPGCGQPTTTDGLCAFCRLVHPTA